MKHLPMGIQTFRDFYEKGYLYVDKTKQIHDLFARGGKYYLKEIALMGIGLDPEKRSIDNYLLESLNC